MASPTMVRTVTGASASYSLQAIFPLSVSIVQYRPGFRLSAGAAWADALRTSAAKSALSATLYFIFHMDGVAPWKLNSAGAEKIASAFAQVREIVSRIPSAGIDSVPRRKILF